MAYLGRLGRLLVIYVKAFTFVLFLITVAYLVFSTPSYNYKECVPLNPRRSNIHMLCKSVLDGSKGVTAYASQFAWCRRTDYMSEDYYISTLSNTSKCHDFLTKNGYLSYDVTAEERSFPLAFSITIHENVEQVMSIVFTAKMLSSVRAKLTYRPKPFTGYHQCGQSGSYTDQQRG